MPESSVSLRIGLHSVSVAVPASLKFAVVVEVVRLPSVRSSVVALEVCHPLLAVLLCAGP